MPFITPDKGGAPGKKSSKGNVKAKNDRAILDRVNKDLKDGRKDLSDWRKEAQQADDFYNGHQWEDDDVRVLMEQMRPQITFNRIKPVIQAIVGTEIQHRQKIVFLPRHPPEEDVAAASDLATDAVDWAIARARGEYERSLTFQDMVIRGVGFIGLSLDFEDDPEGKLCMDRTNPDEMVWDTTARKQNLEDAKWMARRKWMTVAEVKEQFPDADLRMQLDADRPPEQGADNDDLPTSITMTNPDPYREGAQKVTRGFPEPGEKGMVMVTQYQYYEKEPYYRVLESDIPMDGGAGGGAGPGGGAPSSPEPSPGPAPTMGFPPSTPQMPPPPPQVNGMAPPGPPPSSIPGSGPGAPPPAAPAMPPEMVGGQGPGAPPPGPPPGGQGAPPPGMAPPPGGPPPGAEPDEPPPPPPPDKWTSLSVDEFQQLVDRLAAMGQGPPPAVKLRRKKWKQVFSTDNTLLDQQDLWMDGFTYKAMTCLWDSKKRYWYGLVRSMIDPQKGANKWFSQGVHHFNSGAKGALLVETGAVTQPNKLGNDWAKPSPIIQLRDGALSEGRIKVEQPAPFPEAAATMIQYAVAALRDATGVNLDMLGASEGDDPGVTVQKRQTQGLTILANVYAALSRYREDEAQTILKILKKHLSDGRWIRIGGPYNSNYRQLLMEDFAEDYDMVIDDEPRDPNQKRETWDQIQPLLPILIRNNQMPDGLIEYAPLPASIISKLKKQMAEQADAPPPPVKKEENPDWVQSEIDKNHAEIEFIMARAKAISAETGIGVAQTAQEMQMARSEQGGDAAAQQAEQEHERQMNQINLEGKQAETQAKVQQKQQESQMKMHAAQEKSQMDMQHARQKAQLQQVAGIKALTDPDVPGGAATPGGRVM